MRRLLLVRHAVTADTGIRLSGWTAGVSLSADGRAQAEALARRLDSVRLDAVYSSPLDRCLETARAVAARRGLEVELEPGLGEVRYGDWTGQALRDLARLERWRQVVRLPSQARFPGGESLYEVQVRAVATVERLRERHPGQVVLVCSHADVIKAVTAHYLGLHLDHFERVEAAPASLTVFGFLPDPRLLRLNERGGNDDLMPSAEELRTGPEQLRLDVGSADGDPRGDQEPARADA